MKLTEKLTTSYKMVCENAKHVKINFEKVDEMIEQLKNSSIAYWLDSNPYGLLDMNLEDIINFLLIYHTIGDYCFWGDPKWEIETPEGVLDGSFAIMYLVIQHFQKNQNFDMSFEEFSKLLKGNVEIPLLQNRYDNLVIMNDFLKKHKKSFYEMIKDTTSDIELVEFLIKELPYFEDVSVYDEKEIYFYKRAQLLTSDILHVMEKKEKRKIDYSHIIGCADYKIPQVMRCYGMLEFDEELANKVDNKIELEENSREEIEIRAADLAIINYIYEKLEKKQSRMDINDFIWLLGQDKSKMTKPYHRTLTSHY